jgi:uncharacterized protein (UPF0216 family)
MSAGISDEGVLKRLLQHMNSMTPSRRLSLRELASSREPRYTGRDGREYAMSRDELDRITEALRRRGLYDVRLPILVMAEASHEQPVWKVEGEEECAVVSEVLGRQEEESRSKMHLYAPHMAQLRRELPTTTVCLYMP